MTCFVYDYADAADIGRELLGGKGAGLAEMTSLGILVPAGFTVTTQACVEYMRADGVLPRGLRGQIDGALAQVERATGLRFGDTTNPLLVSVRSGAAVSMPGMMDTILNLGLSDAAVKGLARATANERFAHDAYRRLLQMYGEVVEGINGHLFEDELSRLKAENGVQQDVELTTDHLAELTRRFKAIYHNRVGTEFPQDASEQLAQAVRAVFDSWNTPRARAYRRANAIPDDLGTAANVVQMVFGNKGSTSGTGVCFTRDPSTGERGIWGEFLVNAQGEDVVAGARIPEPIDRMSAALPAAHRQLVETIELLEAHYRDMQDIEFHGRGGNALPPTNPDRRALGAGCAARGCRDGLGRTPVQAGGARPNRPCATRSAPASHHRSRGRLRGHVPRAQRVSRRCDRSAHPRC